MDVKRIVKDIDLLQKNKDDLNNRGIYFQIDEQDIHNIYCLIIGQHKEEEDLKSPYTGGFFLFHLLIPDTFPLYPPKISFYPQQNTCRLHPNYYECGKVCLSVIGTWGNDDWSPSNSILSLFNILEVRFNEQPLTFEPGFENTSKKSIQDYNTCVKFGVYKVAIMNVLKKQYRIYDKFQDIIVQYFKDHKQEYIDAISNQPITHIKMPIYQKEYDIYYSDILQYITNFN
jgi:ubiquitin-protein ligase